jgi:copper(I)-binding protein
MKHLITVSLLFISLAASAEIIVKDAWVRTTVAEQKVTGAFMQISSDKAVKLVLLVSSLPCMCSQGKKLIC